jgi:hypothetical protein
MHEAGVRQGSRGHLVQSNFTFVVNGLRNFCLHRSPYCVGIFIGCSGGFAKRRTLGTCEP